MKLLLLALLLLLPSSLTAQDRESKIKTFRNNKRFSVKYDKFKDQTFVKVGPFVVGGDMRYAITGKQLYMSAGFLHRGVTLDEPIKDFMIYFEATGKDWQFLKSRELYAIADGERFDFGEGRYDGDVRGGFQGVGVSESLGFLVTAEAFKKLGTARKVEFRIGTFEMTLKDEHKEAFRDLLTLTKN
jgi:hypothetical protein